MIQALLAQVDHQQALQLVIATGLIAVGLVLWLAGPNVLRAAFSTIGFGLGALVGWITAEALGLEASAQWIAAGVVAVFTGVLIAAAYRVILAAGLAMILGLAAPMSIWIGQDGWFAAQTMMANISAPAGGTAATSTSTTTASSTQQQEDDLDVRATMDELVSRVQDALQHHAQTLQSGGEENADDDPTASSVATNVAGEHAEHRLRTIIGPLPLDVVEHLSRSATDMWQRTPEQLQHVFLGAAVLGAVTGLVLAVFYTSTAATVLTTCTGSVLWMSGMVPLVRLGGPEAEHYLPRSSLAWLVMWVIISLIGLAIQWKRTKPNADKPG